MRWLQPGMDWYIQAPPPLSAPPPPWSHSWLISWESRRRLRGLLPPHYLFLFSAAPPVAPSSWSGSSGVKSTAPLGVLSSFVGRGQSCVLWSLSASSQGQRSEAATLGRAVSVWQGRLFRRGGKNTRSDMSPNTKTIIILLTFIPGRRRGSGPGKRSAGGTFSRSLEEEGLSRHFPGQPGGWTLDICWTQLGKVFTLWMSDF